MKALILSWCKMVLFILAQPYSANPLLTLFVRATFGIPFLFLQCFSFSPFSLVLVRTKEKDSAPKVITTDQEMAVITKKALPSAAPHLLSALSQFISHNEKTPCVCSSALLQMK